MNGLIVVSLSPTHNQTLPKLTFGLDVGIEGDVIVVGAPGAGWFKGRAYVFEKPTGGWADMTQTALEVSAYCGLEAIQRYTCCSNSW